MTAYSLLKNAILSAMLQWDCTVQSLHGEKSLRAWHHVGELGHWSNGYTGELKSLIKLSSVLFFFLLFPEWGQKYRSWLKERPGQIPHAFTEFLTFGQLIPPSENVKSWLKLAIFPVLSIKLKRLKQLWPVLSKITLTQTRSFARIAFLQSQPEGVNSTLLTQYEICKEGSKACNFVARAAKRNNLPSNITKSLGKWSETECTERFVLSDLLVKYLSHHFCF